MVKGKVKMIKRGKGINFWYTRMRHLILFVLMFFPLIADGMTWSLTHKITNKDRYTNSEASDNLNFNLTYQPDLSLEIWSDEDKKIDIQQVIRQSNKLNYTSSEWEGKIDLELYRSLVRYSALSYEYRLGLQQLNFGQARILRPLQWFDNIDPREESKDSDGVYALLARKYFLDNSNLWGWVILDDEEFNDDYSGNNFIKNLEYGGRWQYPFKETESAVTVHYKTLENSDYESETKLGFDLRKDIVIGFWAETSMSVLHGQDKTSNSSLLTAGVDYTFSIGNGLYLLLENLFISDLGDDLLPDKAKSTALQVQYPLNIFDSVQSIVTYDWQSEGYNLFLSYARSYDYLSVLLNFYRNGEHKQYDYYDGIKASIAIELGLETKF